MKKKTLLYILAILLVQISKAQSSDTIFITDFGVKPYSYENSVTQIAIEACKQKGAKVLSFEKGRYDIWPESAMRKEYYISNTSTESECPSKIKTVGLLFENIQNLKVEGNGALLMFHGKMWPYTVIPTMKLSMER